MEPTTVSPQWTHDYIRCKRLKCSRDCLVARTGYQMGRVSAREEEHPKGEWTRKNQIRRRALRTLIANIGFFDRRVYRFARSIILSWEESGELSDGQWRHVTRLSGHATTNKGRTLVPVADNSPSSRRNQSSIDFAIEELTARGIVFSAEDVADCARLVGLNDTIKGSLRAWCQNKTLLPLDEEGHLRYLSLRAVEYWWVAHTLRIARGKLDYVHPAQLALSLSLSFLSANEPQWHTPPASVLDVGRKWAMVAEGCVPNTFVFPWASLLGSNWHLVEMFSATFAAEGSDSWARLLVNDSKVEENWRRMGDDAITSLTLHTPIDGAVDRLLSSLTEREADILRGRLGIDTERPSTLETLGASLGVTRERVRQIEHRARRRLAGLKPNRAVWIGFAADFIQNKGSLLTDEDSMTPRRKLAAELIGLNVIEIPKLQLRVVATDDNRKQLQGALMDTETSSLGNAGDSRPQIPQGFHFLTKSDGERLSDSWRDYRNAQITKTKPLMLREALRSLGRAAHFTEIAEEANRLFPEHQNLTHNWHVALSYPSVESLGIVWIGRKGMYGLAEHGYSRPETDLAEAVTLIVEESFAETGQPVPSDIVLLELSNQRREIHPNSVTMALSFNDRLVDLGGGRYAPKNCNSDVPSYSPSDDFDIAAAFEAFSCGEVPTEEGSDDVS